MRSLCIGSLLIAFVGLTPALSRSDSRIEQELLSSFSLDIVEAWYPKSEDSVYGGFYTGFAADWSLEGKQDKFLVTQSRHIWTLSQLAAFLDEPGYGERAIAGFRFLVDAMWDKVHGGFYELVDQTGLTVLKPGKTAYGMSFSIYACSNLFEATGNSESLDYAKRAFLWMEENSWDAEFGGYVNAMENSGEWSEERINGFDTPIVGAKDYNSSIHMLECLTSLYRVWPDPNVRERLEGMLEIVRDRFVQPKGYLQLYFTREWKKLSLSGEERDTILANYYSDHVSWGHDVETAFLLLEASHHLYGVPDPRTRVVAKRLVDHALETGWDRHEGSFWDGGYYFDENGECEVIRPVKVWWVAAEGLNALLLMSKIFPGESVYEERFRQQWNYIKSHLIDPENGGWREFGADRSPEKVNAPKAHVWKANYHDARAYINCLKMLRGEFSLLKH